MWCDVVCVCSLCVNRAVDAKIGGGGAIQLRGLVLMNLLAGDHSEVGGGGGEICRSQTSLSFIFFNFYIECL